MTFNPSSVKAVLMILFTFSLFVLYACILMLFLIGIPYCSVKTCKVNPLNFMCCIRCGPDEERILDVFPREDGARNSG